MSLLQQIKEDLDKARKVQDRIDVTVLTTLYAEAAMKGKNNGNRESTDEEVTETVIKFVKNAKEMLEHYKDDEDMALVYQDEIDTYNNYLPQQLTEDELKAIIHVLIADNNLNMPKDMGQVMKALSNGYTGRYDGKEASMIARRYKTPEDIKGLADMTEGLLEAEERFEKNGSKIEHK